MGAVQRQMKCKTCKHELSEDEEYCSEGGQCGLCIEKRLRKQSAEETE